MQNTKTSHPHCEEARTACERLDDLRRRAWAALSDLGLTEPEIAAYFGDDLDDLRRHLPDAGTPCAI